MKKAFLALALLFATSATFGQTTFQTPRNSPDTKDPAFQLQKFNQFFRYLNGSYVSEVDNSKLVETAIIEMLAQLDPHSAYVTPEEMKGVNESFQGSFSGIGVEFNVLHDTLIVVNTVVGGPAEKVGVRPNDRIVEIDGQSVIGITRDQVPQKLRGKKGSVVEISIVRRDSDKPLSFRIVRDNIPINAVDAAYLLAPQIGYIKVNRFSSNTLSELNESLDKLGTINALVLDLRGNGGGLLNQAIEMSGLFLPKNSLVVSTEGRLVPPEKFSTKQNGRLRKERLVVLIDESSASASEIVAGAIQDWDRGLIVGRRSFGKGLVQSQYPLIDGSAVRITVARYHTPTGRVIQRPYELGHAKEYYESFMDRLDQRSLDTVPGIDSLKYRTLHKKRTVYGGGGIYPDVYVAADTTGYSPYLGQLFRLGVISEFVTNYMDQHRTVLEGRYSDFDRFMERYRVDEEMIAALVAQGEKQQVKADPEGLEIARERLELYLKALVAQKLWTTNEYYRVLNSSDPMLEQTLRIFSDWAQTASSIQ